MTGSLFIPSRRRAPLATATACVVIAAVLLAGCSGATGSTGSPPGSAGSSLTVVASTNVWAAVAAAVGGDTVKVTAILDDPNADPHSFEATPKIKLDMSKAALVIVNGGGYDDWARDTAKSLDPAPNVLDAVVASGLDTSGDFNEHVFYDLDSVIKVADAIAAQLSIADPAAATTFTANAAAFDGKITDLKGQAAAIRTAHPGIKVVATEPVAGHLIDTLGFTDITPAGFSAAIEAETEVSVKDLDDTRNLLSTKTAQVLFNNIQTSGEVTSQLVAAAGSAGIPVVGVTETLPAGVSDYVAWMQANLAQISAALK